MRKSVLDRIKTLESLAERRQPDKSITFFDEELGLTMQIIGEGLVVPVPMTVEEWEEYVSKELKSAQKPGGTK